MLYYLVRIGFCLDCLATLEEEWIVLLENLANSSRLSEMVILGIVKQTFCRFSVACFNKQFKDIRDMLKPPVWIKMIMDYCPVTILLYYKIMLMSI